MITHIKPIFRALKYSWLYHQARWKTLQNCQESSSITFIVGCGRSGTTILGKLLSEHPQTKYWFEPYHLWAAIDKNTDVLGLYSPEAAQLILDEEHAVDFVKDNFWKLFKVVEGQQLIEKTPLNVFRIGYIKSLAPQARFIHLVRDGVDVAHSIGRIASDSPYKIFGKPELNQWWGMSGRKWKTLKREGMEAGYWPEHLSRLQTEEQRGAYEWLTSLREMDRWRDTLGEDCLEIVYDQLVENPKQVLCQLCEFLNLEVSDSWLAIATQSIRSQKRQADKTLDLPNSMAEAFNRYQIQYQFAQRATTNEIVML